MRGARYPKVDVRCSIFDARCSMLEVWCPMSGAWCLVTGDRCAVPGVRSCGWYAPAALLQASPGDEQGRRRVMG